MRRVSAVVGLAGVLVVALAPSALADYLTVAGGLNQREWVTASQWYPTSFVPRADGRLIVFAENLCPACGANDGYPHLVTGYGQALSASNRFGGKRTPRNLDGFMAEHRLLAFVTSVGPCRDSACETALYELDPRTGLVKRKVGVETNASAQVFDPVTRKLGMLVMHDLSSHPYGTFDEMDLDDGTVRTMFRFDPMSEMCNSTSCAAKWAAFDPSGDVLFTGCVELNYLCAWNRTGRLLYRIQTAPTPQPFTPGVEPWGALYPISRLFHDELLYLDELLNVWSVPHPSASAVPVQLAQANRVPSPGAANRSPIQLSPNGDLIVPHDRAVMCLGACTRVAPDAVPGSPGHRSDAGSPARRPAHDTTPPTEPGTGTVPVAGPPAGSALQASTATQAQTSAQSAAQVGAQTSGQAAAKVAALPNAVGLVDVPQDDAAMAMHASLLAPAPTVLAARLAVAALALTVLAAAAAWSPLHQVQVDSEQEKVR